MASATRGMSVFAAKCRGIPVCGWAGTTWTAAQRTAALGEGVGNQWQSSLPRPQDPWVCRDGPDGQMASTERAPSSCALAGCLLHVFPLVRFGKFLFDWILCERHGWAGTESTHRLDCLHQTAGPFAGGGRGWLGVLPFACCPVMMATR